MANFEPNSIIHIGNVPFDNTYRHVMTFADAESQASYFSSVCDSALRPAGRDNPDGYTYVRMNNAIRVPFNAERLYTKNYVMYKNANYGQKWFYAFIVEINYVNENMTELVLELDVMQTWYFDYTLEECYVEREHVADDSIGANLIPEPEFQFNVKSMDDQVIDFSKHMYVVVETSAKPNYVGDLGPFGTTAVDGGVYSGVACGGAYYVFDPETENDPGTNPATSYKEFIRQMNIAGGAESITNVFMFPQEYVNVRLGADRRLQDVPTLGVHNLEYTTRPSNLDGYVPRNNKLFTYPYCYCNISDNNGNSADLKYELWNTGSKGYMLDTVSGIAPDASMFVHPVNYAGELAPMDNGISFPCTVRCSWVYSSYQTWVAQNALANAMTIATSLAMIAVPAARGLGAASKAITSTAKAKGGMDAVRNLKGGTGTALLGREAKRAGIETAQSGWGGLSIAAGAAQMASLTGQWSAQSLVPNVTRGNASSNSIFATGLMNLHIKQMTLQSTFAQSLDDFFDMYGYEVDRVKVPNRTGRPSWNYVKTQNACHHGNVPAQDMAQINSIYDAGVTFWHTSDIGNYSLANK